MYTNEYFILYDVDKLVDIATLYLQHGGTEPVSSLEPLSPFVLKGMKLLRDVSKKMPGHLHCQLLLATASFLSGEFTKAHQYCLQCLRLDQSFAEVHILLARIHLAQRQHKMAEYSLEQALSLDFSVRQSHKYHMVKAKVLVEAGDLQEALKVLESAMRLPGIGKPAAGQGSLLQIFTHLSSKLKSERLYYAE